MGGQRTAGKKKATEDGAKLVQCVAATEEDGDVIGQEQPITNDNSSKDVDAENGDKADMPIPNDDGSKEGMDAEDREEPITSDHNPEEDMHPHVGSKSEAKRTQPPRHLDGMVDWTLAEHKGKREDMLRTEWANVQELWTEEYQRELFYGFERLDEKSAQSEA